MLRITDTLTGKLRDFEPRDPGKVSMYVCGPTVYDAPHLGHARSALTYDVARRYLEWRGFDVTLVSNITDIDDNIIERAAEDGVTEDELTAEYEQLYIDEMRAIGVIDPHIRPHATEYVAEMIGVIEELLAAEQAYVVEGRGVYFDVDRFADYGRLVHRGPDELRESAGARVDVDETKDDPLDFVLWKAAKPGEPTWDSPWGPGRPGWHIECVAMALHLLGDGFDIHGGGDDLIFPHHENERAEAEACGHRFAEYWLHNGMLNVAGEKMSKSLGNFRTLGDALAVYDPRAIRLLVLQSHYRSTMEMSDDAMAGGAAAIERIDAFVRRTDAADLAGDVPLDDQAVEGFIEAMDNDFGTPAAVAVLFDLIRAGHAALDEGDFDTAARTMRTFVELGGVLGIEGRDVEVGDDDDEIESLVAERQAAREAKDFGRADELRGALVERGVEVEDTAAGPVWRRVATR